MLVEKKSVVIVGGGIVGLSCALFAQRCGHHVKIIDPRGVGNGCSYGNAGVLAVSECLPVGTPELIKELPRLLFGSNSGLKLRFGYAPKMLRWFYHFLKSCHPQRVHDIAVSLTPLLNAALDAHHCLSGFASCRHLIHEGGWIKAFSTDEAFRRAEIDFLRVEQYGVRCQYHQGDAVANLEPRLSGIFRHAVMLPDCQRVDSPAIYLQLLAEEFFRQGGEHIRAEIVGVDRREGRVISVHSQTETYKGENFIIAAGAHSKHLARAVGCNVPLDTERGYHLEFAMETDDLPRVPVFWAEESIVMSPINNVLRVTSGVELAGLRHRPDFTGLRKKREKIRSALRGRVGDITAEWLGFRPSMPDSLPVIGRAEAATNAYLAFGHGHLGLTLGPITGKIVADLMTGASTEFNLASYSPSRFNKSLLKYR